MRNYDEVAIEVAGNGECEKKRTGGLRMDEGWGGGRLTGEGRGRRREGALCVRGGGGA